jgi:osmoprotectant transport system permease protein
MTETARGSTFPGFGNRVRLLLMLVALAAAGLLGFVGLAPNRLVSGQALAIWQVAGSGPAGLMGGALLALLAGALPQQSRMLSWTATLVAGAALILLCAIAGEAARVLAATRGHAARTSLGGGFWVIGLCLALTLIDGLQRLAAGPALRLAAACAIGVPIVGLAVAGQFDALSIAREFQTHRDVFLAELERHLALVFAAVALSLAIGLPLGLGAVRRPGWGGPLFGTLNLLQTIPSIALFGLLITPLSLVGQWVPALGVRGIGPAPALVALVLYALLPIVRNAHAGFSGIDGAVVETAAGMGMTGRQIFWRVELPLASPVLLAGVRIVVVQAIGLTVVAALIGAGGLGTFVFQGLGQYALDLVLLGAIPTVLLALGADFGLEILTILVRRSVSP